MKPGDLVRAPVPIAGIVYEVPCWLLSIENGQAVVGADVAIEGRVVAGAGVSRPVFAEVAERTLRFLSSPADVMREGGYVRKPAAFDP